MELVTPDLGLIFWMLVSFSIVLFILRKFAWDPITQTLKIREESIEEALNSAEKAKEEMAQLKAENEKLLDEAREERDKIIKEAVAVANKIKEEAKEDAERIGKKLVDDARTTIETEKKSALAEVKNQVASLSLKIAEKILRKQLENNKEQKDLVKEFLKDAETKLN